MLSHHVQPVSVPTRVTGVRDAPDSKEYKFQFDFVVSRPTGTSAMDYILSLDSVYCLCCP